MSPLGIKVLLKELVNFRKVQTTCMLVIQTDFWLLYRNGFVLKVAPSGGRLHTENKESTPINLRFVCLIKEFDLTVFVCADLRYRQCRQEALRGDRTGEINEIKPIFLVVFSLYEKGENIQVKLGASMCAGAV